MILLYFLLRILTDLTPPFGFLYGLSPRRNGSDLKSRVTSVTPTLGDQQGLYRQDYTIILPV